MSFEFRVGGAGQQTYTNSTAQNKAVEEIENEPIRLTMGNNEDKDTVSISIQGKEKLAAMQSGSKSEESSDSSDSTTSSIDDQIEKVQEQIKKLQEEIEKLKQDPEKNKDQISAKQNELMTLQSQLVELQDQKNKAAGTSAKGGTRAEGMSNSLT